MAEIGAAPRLKSCRHSRPDFDPVGAAGCGVARNATPCYRADGAEPMGCNFPQRSHQTALFPSGRSDDTPGRSRIDRRWLKSNN